MIHKYNDKNDLLQRLPICLWDYNAITFVPFSISGRPVARNIFNPLVVTVRFQDH